MSDPIPNPSPPPQTTEPAEPPPVPLSVPLPSLSTPRAPEQVVAALDTAARRGRLAGFESVRTRDLLFRAAAFGTPFDGLLEARATPSDQGTLLRFDARIKPLIPLIFAVVLAASVWPGVVLTESMIASFFPTSTAWRYTWWWYMPLTLPFAPWAFWSALKRSRASIHDSAHRAIAKIAGELGK